MPDALSEGADMQVMDLDPPDERRVHQAAEVLAAAFPGEHHPGGWAHLPDALAEVRESFGSGHLSLVAIEGDAVVGWIGGSRHYHGNTWELHPLAVHPGWQRRGIGRALVDALEARVRAEGGQNIWLTTDDDTGETSLAGQPLYPDVLAGLATLRADGGRVSFYLSLGYSLTGGIPDAYAPGHHELVFAKRLETRIS